MLPEKKPPGLNLRSIMDSWAMADTKVLLGTYLQYLVVLVQTQLIA